MSQKVLTGIAIAAMLSLPAIAHAQDGAAAGATTGDRPTSERPAIKASSPLP